MATITVNPTYLDSAVRTAAQVMTINGGSLVIRTDTRWHSGAPASMTGVLGSAAISATLGGVLELDGTKVRWLAYNSGSGTVPAINTIISQGGVSGVLLGVWASLTSTPSAVGAAMPTTGFIKFREVTGIDGFIEGALTGITANATGKDVVGWIEVVFQQSTAITVPRLGSFKVRGDLFELGTTTGVANQVVQIPTNGSTTTYVPGVWIATTSTPLTREDYEFYPSIPASLMTTTNLGTDIRSKFVCMETNGAIRIGHNGTGVVGFVPPEGRKVVIGNVFGRQATSAARATNAIPHATSSTRPIFTTTSAGVIDIENFTTDWFLNFAQPYSVRLHYVATFDYVIISECATSIDINDGGTGTSQNINSRVMHFTSCSAGGLVNKWKAQRFSAVATGHAIEVTTSKGINFIGVDAGIIQYARSTGMAFQISSSSKITKTNCNQFNSNTVYTASSECIMTNLSHVDRYVGETNATTGLYAVLTTGRSDNIKVDGVNFGLNRQITNCHPYLGAFRSLVSKNITFRNLGTRSSFESGGVTVATQTGNVYESGGDNENIRVQRCYITPTRTGTILTNNSDRNIAYEHVYGSFTTTIVDAGLNSTIKNCGGTSSIVGQISVYGTHFWDSFVSDTVGRIVLPMNEPTNETAQYVQIVGGSPKFTSSGQLAMLNVNDEIIIEQHYFVKGIIGLTNTAPVVTGTNVTYVSGADWGNHSIFFQYDIGEGWNSVWLNLTGPNLNNVGVINPAIGVKLKYRIVCKTTSTTNAIGYIRVATNSTLIDQNNNLYPLDTIKLSITNLVEGSDVVILDAGTTNIREAVDQNPTNNWTYSYEDIGNFIDIGILKPGYVPLYIRNYKLTNSSSSIPVFQIYDRNYGA